MAKKNPQGQESVRVTDPNTGFTISFSINTRLKRNLDEKVKGQLEKKDKDTFLILDGSEGSGKSTLAFQIGKYVDPTLDLSRVVFSPDDFRAAIIKAKKGECIIYDEAFTGFSSRSSLSPINRVLVSLAMQMRQKNLFVIIVLPTIFLLDKYIAMFRAKALIHVWENKGRRGYFKVYNNRKKRYLLLFGAKTMSYTGKMCRTNFKGRFYGKFVLGDASVEEDYRKRKEQALADSEKTSMSSAQVRYKDQRDLMLFLFKRYTKMTYKELEQVISDYDFVMSFQQLSKVCSKFGYVSSESDKKEEETIEKESKEFEKGDLPPKSANLT